MNRLGTTCLVVVLACDGGARREPAASPPTAHAPGDARAPADAAVAAPPPTQATCAAPSAAERDHVEKQIRAVQPEGAIRFACAEHAGWLVAVGDAAWLVPARGAAVPLESWTVGPIYDIDGDGHPEATTVGYASELKIWFDGGDHPSYVLGADGSQWVARDGKILVGRGDSTLAVTPGTAYLDDSAPAAPAATAPAFSCTSDAAQAAAIAHMLLHGRSPAPCAQLPAADKATVEHAIGASLLASRDVAGVSAIRFTWGCTSHGDTPVVVDFEGFRDQTGAELWSVRDGKPRKLDGVTSPAPDEYSGHDGIALGPSGDFDGDGAAESIVESSHHASAHGTTFAYYVMLGTKRENLPGDLVAREVAGKRDGIVQTSGFAAPHVATTCHASDPNSQLDCELQPPAGYRRADTCGAWDWEQHPPRVIALGAGSRFVPVPAAAVVTETATERAALSAP